MKFAVLLAAVAGATALSQDATELLLRERFSEWRLKFNKTYSSPEEESRRFTNFVASVEKVAEWMEKAERTGDSATFGLTKFADMTAEEFKSTHLNFVPSAEHVKDLPLAKPTLRVGSTPASFDWRTLGKVTAVKDQGYCGSCWAHGAVESIESSRAIKYGTLTELSVQQLVSCDTTDSGCRGGDTPPAMNYVMGAGGVATAASYPYSSTTYNGRSGTCSAFTVAPNSKITGYSYATPGCTRDCSKQNEATLAATVSSVGAPSICVDASSWSLYTGGVFTATSGGGCSNAYSSLDHCVQLIGYHGIDTSSGYWIVRNSWAADWGEQGMIYLAYGANTCGVADEAILPVMA